MNLKRLLYHNFIFFTAIFSSCNFSGVAGSGVVVTESRPITEITDIYVEGQFEVFLKQGNFNKLFLKMDDNLLENTITEIHGDELHITSKSSVMSSTVNEIYITVRKLDKITLLGAVDLECTNALNSSDLSVTNSGLSDMYLKTYSNSISINSSGSTTLEIDGASHSLKVNMAGYGSINSLGLACNIVELNLSGSIKSRVFSKDYLDVSVSGTSTVLYKGSPELLQESSRQGSVKHISN